MGMEMNSTFSRGARGLTFRRRISLAVGIVGLGAAALVSAPSVGAAPAAYRDYVGPDTTQRFATQATMPGAAMEVAPKATARAESQAAMKAATAGKVWPFPSHPVVPRRLRAGAPTAANVLTTASISTTVCNYPPNVLTANPGPPASGSSFAVARAINGVPYSQSGKGAGVFQGGQGYVGANGFGTATISRSSVAETGEAVPVGAGWPAGSSIEFWYNPVFSGRGSTQSSISPIYQYSSASVQERIDSGAGASTEIYYQNLWDLSMTNTSGVGQTTPTWYFPGASSGFYYRQVPVTIAGTYRFTIRSTTTVSATPAIGAGAAADMDFGSDVLDTPARLSPYWFGVMPNANTATGQPYSHVTIAYILPAGWGTGC